MSIVISQETKQQMTAFDMAQKLFREDIPALKEGTFLLTPRERVRNELSADYSYDFMEEVIAEYLDEISAWLDTGPDDNGRQEREYYDPFEQDVEEYPF